MSTTDFRFRRQLDVETTSLTCDIQHAVDQPKLVYNFDIAVFDTPLSFYHLAIFIQNIYTLLNFNFMPTLSRNSGNEIQESPHITRGLVTAAFAF